MNNLTYKGFTDFLKKHWLIIFIFLFAPYYVLRPLFKYETWPSGHDCTTTIFSAWHMIKTMKEDFHFPLTWVSEDHVFNGNLFWCFYQPLSYLIVYFMSLFTSSFEKDCVFSSLKAAVYLSFLISEIGMFLLLKIIFRDLKTNNAICVFSSLVYLLAPYRFIDLYSRNAYSELWVFPWMPFYFLGFYKLFFLKETKGWIFILAMTSCLLLTHLMPSFFFIVITHIAFLIFLWIKKDLFGFFKSSKNILFWWFISSIAGILIASFYIFPAMNSVKFTVGDTAGFDRVSLTHVLENIDWYRFMLNPRNFDKEWQVGQLFLFSLIGLNLFLFFKKQSILKDLLIFLNFCIFVTLLFIMSKSTWEHMPSVFYSLQFPWRLFLVYSFYCSVIAAILAFELNLKIPILIVLLGFHFYTGERFLHYGGVDFVAKYYNTESWINKFYREEYTTALGGLSHGFLPKTSHPELFNFKYQSELGNNEKYPDTYLLNLKPGINLISHKKQGSNFEYELDLERASFLIFKQFFFPTWKLYIDSKRSKDLYLTEFGYIGFEVPAGKHTIKIRSN